jgi:3-methyladenine DNA glycosylase AlkD
MSEVAGALAVASGDLAGARRVARSFARLDEADIDGLFWSEDERERLVAVLVLEAQFRAGNDGDRARIVEQFLTAVRLERVDSPALLDEAAETIVGEWFLDRARGPLFALAKSDIVWDRRAAVVASMTLAKRGDGAGALEIAERMIRERSELIQEPLGRLLREAGKRADGRLLVDLLDRVAERMPRATLAVAIENLGAADRARFTPLL